MSEGEIKADFCYRNKVKERKKGYSTQHRPQRRMCGAALEQYGCEYCLAFFKQYWEDGRSFKKNNKTFGQI